MADLEAAEPGRVIRVSDRQGVREFTRVADGWTPKEQDVVLRMHLFTGLVADGVVRWQVPEDVPIRVGNLYSTGVDLLMAMDQGENQGWVCGMFTRNQWSGWVTRSESQLRALDQVNEQPDWFDRMFPVLTQFASLRSVQRALATERDRLVGQIATLEQQVRDAQRAAEEARRPPEPTELGAVVHDNAGRVWVRTDYRGAEWYNSGRGF